MRVAIFMDELHSIIGLHLENKYQSDKNKITKHSNTYTSNKNNSFLIIYYTDMYQNILTILTVFTQLNEAS